MERNMMMPFLRQDVEEVLVHLEVRIGHGRFPQLFLLQGQRFGHSAGLVNRAEDIEKIGKRVQDAARVKVPEPEHASVGAAGVIGEDRLERRMALFGGAPLLARIA
jgi:hypothetical protein